MTTEQALREYHQSAMETELLAEPRHLVAKALQEAAAMIQMHQDHDSRYRNQLDLIAKVFRAYLESLPNAAS